MGFLDRILGAITGKSTAQPPEAQAKSQIEDNLDEKAKKLVIDHVLYQETVQNRWSFNASSLPTITSIASSDDDLRRLVIRAAIELTLLFHKGDFRALGPIEALKQKTSPSHWATHRSMEEVLAAATRRKLACDTNYLVQVLDLCSKVSGDIWYVRTTIFKYVVRLCGSLPKPVDKKILAGLKKLKLVEGVTPNADIRKLNIRINNLAGETDGACLAPGEPFGEAVNSTLSSASLANSVEWKSLVGHCMTATSSAPSSKWLKNAFELVSQIGEEEFKKVSSNWLRLFCDIPLPTAEDYHTASRLGDKYTENITLVKGLAWCNAVAEIANPQILGDVALSALKKIPGHGPKSLKVGNACITVLGMIGTLDAAAQLSRLNVKVKYFKVLELVQKSLREVAAKLNLTPEDVEEMCAPSFGLDENGVRQEELGDCFGEIVFSAGTAEMIWKDASGAQLKSLPTQVKKDYAAEVKELTAATKEIAKAYVTEKFRVDRIMLSDRQWDYETWHTRYIQHPLVGDIAKRLIWRFSQADRSTEAIYSYGEFLGLNGKTIDWLSEETNVRLWHPLGEDPEKVLAWREYLETKEIIQPFKQAHRETYIVTDAERHTDTYSNRFAAHILRQHQFAALCRERGWKFQLLGGFDNHNTPTRELPQFGLRVEYWVENPQDLPMTDLGISLYITTDQVRYIRGNDLVHMDDIPSRVFSEVMRDVDMFVGVCSSGNDPNWIDSGTQPLLGQYWQNYSFGELTSVAQNRRELLERLLPKLKIADVTQIKDRFLIVKGKIRSYKIHLGSGNILMSPNDQYLCIVPDRSHKPENKVFLPFEGDHTFALILSKAFLLAQDDKIKDPVIVNQLRPKKI